MPLEEINPVEIGERLRIAREAAGISQAAAATAINVARTTLVAIEQGQRRVRRSELQQLAKLYRTSVNALLRREAIQVDLAPRFRKLAGSSNASVDAAAMLLGDLAKAEVELESLLGVKRVPNYPPERPILRGDVRAQAEQDAMELRQRLGLGASPVADIVTLLELELGVRVYVRRLHGDISGLFAYDDALGPCILLNANHPRERRTQSAAHEMGHLVSTRREPEILHSYEGENSREERYANAFARAFLTPARGVAQKFEEVTAGSERLTRRHVIVLAHFFGVSREAIVRRVTPGSSCGTNAQPGRCSSARRSARRPLPWHSASPPAAATDLSGCLLARRGPANSGRNRAWLLERHCSSLDQPELRRSKAAL